MFATEGCVVGVDFGLRGGRVLKDQPFEDPKDPENQIEEIAALGGEEKLKVCDQLEYFADLRACGRLVSYVNSFPSGVRVQAPASFAGASSHLTFYLQGALSGSTVVARGSPVPHPHMSRKLFERIAGPEVEREWLPDPTLWRGVLEEGPGG